MFILLLCFARGVCMLEKQVYFHTTFFSAGLSAAIKPPTEHCSVYLDCWTLIWTTFLKFLTFPKTFQWKYYFLAECSRELFVNQRFFSSFVDVTLERIARQCVLDLSDIILSTDWFKTQLTESIIFNLLAPEFYI